jgi:membrane protein required for colicin V production
MTGFDYAVLAAIAASLLLGLWRGVVSEVLALLAWVAAFFVARAAAPTLSPMLAHFTHETTLQYVAAFAAVFVGILVIFAIGRMVMASLLRAAGLGWADRLLGMVFGIGRGLLVVLVAVLLGGLTPLPHEEWWRDALLAPPLETAVVAGKPWLPQLVAQRIRFR